MHILLLFVFVVPVFGQKEECNMEKAEACAISYQRQFDEAFMEYEAQEDYTNTAKFQALCSSVIMDSVTTKCYHNNIKLCNEEDSKYIKVQWEETMKDVLSFCNSLCTRFQNLTQCKEKIYENGIQDGQVERFCRTFNNSIDCANRILEDSCLFNITFYNSLIRWPSRIYYKRACATGCGNLDETVAAINKCWRHHYDQTKSECERHISFRNCLHEKADICTEIDKLVPASIQYSLRERTCTTTTASTTQILETTTTTSFIPTSELEISTSFSPDESTSQSPTVVEVSTTQITESEKTKPQVKSPTTPISYATTTGDMGAKHEINSKHNTNITGYTSQSDTTVMITTTKLDNKIKPTEPTVNNAIIDGKYQEYIESCIPFPLNDSSSPLITSRLNFRTCLSFITTLSCLNKNLSSMEEVYKLNSLLPQYLLDFMHNGSLHRCQNVMDNYSTNIQRIETLCGRPRRQDGCTGHGYGILGCRSGADANDTKGDVFLYICFILTVARLNIFFCG